jgi:putative flippase GtrA
LRAAEALRFVLNGLAATAAHFLTLAFLLHVARLPSAGVANTLAAVIGITVSFLGSRYFVFRAGQQPVLGQFARFWTLYLLLALVQGVILFFWTDLAGLDYRIGFLIGTVVQALGAYVGGKLWVFSRPS